MKKRYGLLVFLFTSTSILATGVTITEYKAIEENYQTNNPFTQEKNTVTETSYFDDFIHRLRPYQGTKVYIDYGRGEKLDRHLDIEYSFRYLFTRPMSFSYDTDEYEWDWDLSFTFTGEFDFYAGTRDSGPVIGRRYNPGFMFNARNNKKKGITGYTISVEHESNGQATNSLRALIESSRDLRNQYKSKYPNLDSHYYLLMATDTISRSTEAFIAASITYRVNDNDLSWQKCNDRLACFDFYLKLRESSFSELEDQVFWDPSMFNATLEEHQGSQLSIYSMFDNSKQSVQLTYRTGELFGGRFGDKNTWDISYTRKVRFDIGSRYFTLPFIISYHHGYLEELYRYSYKSSYLSVGLNFNL